MSPRFWLVGGLAVAFVEMGMTEKQLGGRVGDEVFCFGPIRLSRYQDSVLSSMK